MKYRKFGNTGVNISALGFGCMRLPMLDTDNGQIVDEEKSVQIIRQAIDRGVNYFDTAYGYCGGKSEETLGKALKDGYRDKVYVSTKMPTFHVKEKSDFRRFLEEQLRRLDVGAIDFYHFHALNDKLWEDVVLKFDMLDDALKAKEEGLIKHISFSFHDKPEIMMKIIDSGVFESVLCQYNLLDRSNEEAIAYANQKGLGVVIMGPVAGGRLVAPSDVFKKLFGRDAAGTPELALRFVLGNPHVSCALSGMSDENMVEENAKTADDSSPLTKDELDRIAKALDEIKNLANLYCTGCEYCLPCPMNINIPHLFRIMNYHKVYGMTAYAQELYMNIGKNEREGSRPTECSECGSCESKCPQNIEIRKQLKEIIEVLGE
ncbi:MAG: aldo/keto reductase [Clostridia bacterium]|jgi:predicted aldo/keto reductase-like oxidoreductase|nr:aldo/keto reductase [Clostridiaceae bacterium]